MAQGKWPTKTQSDVFRFSGVYRNRKVNNVKAASRTRKQVDRGSKIADSGCCQDNSEGQDGRRFDTAGRGGAARRAAHLRIELSFESFSCFIPIS